MENTILTTDSGGGKRIRRRGETKLAALVFFLLGAICLLALSSNIEAQVQSTFKF